MRVRRVRGRQGKQQRKRPGSPQAFSINDCWWRCGLDFAHGMHKSRKTNQGDLDYHARKEARISESHTDGYLK